MREGQGRLWGVGGGREGSGRAVKEVEEDPEEGEEGEEEEEGGHCD